jgi:predicted Zn-dependent protease
MIVWLLLLAQDPEALSARGAAAMRAQRFAEAERVYRQLMEAQPSNPMWRFNLGLAMYSAGRAGEAAAEFEGFLKARPEPGPAHLMLGSARLKTAEACAAVSPLETAVRWRASAETLPLLAEAYYGCQRYADAAATYDRAGDDRRAARAYWQARRYPEAAERFRRVESRYRDDAEFHYEYGDTLVRLSGAEAGLEHLERAVATKPALLPARAELGKALLELGRASEAIPHLEAASGADPALLLPLSRALRAAGRREEADRAQADYRARMGARER